MREPGWIVRVVYTDLQGSLRWRVCRRRATLLLVLMIVNSEPHLDLQAALAESQRPDFLIPLPTLPCQIVSAIFAAVSSDGDFLR